MNEQLKRPRGRPKGSKNKSKNIVSEENTATNNALVKKKRGRPLGSRPIIGKPVKKYNYTKKTGRPSPYDPNYHPQAAIEILSSGASRTVLAAEFGVDKATIYDWILTYPEFSAAYSRGNGFVERDIVGKCIRAASGHIGPDGKYYPPSFPHAQFLLKNINPDEWRDRREYFGEVKVSDMTEEEISRRIKSILVPIDNE